MVKNTLNVPGVAQPKQGLWVLNRDGTALEPVSGAEIYICGSGYPTFLAVIPLTSGVTTVSRNVISTGRELCLEADVACYVTFGASGTIGNVTTAFSGIPLAVGMTKTFPIIDFSGWINTRLAVATTSGEVNVWMNP